MAVVKLVPEMAGRMSRIEDCGSNVPKGRWQRFVGHNLTGPRWSGAAGATESRWSANGASPEAA